MALRALEDLGYYCIDNIPAALLKAAVDEVVASKTRLLAVGVDARNRAQDLKSLPEVLRELQGQGVNTEIIFLHSSDEILLKRYSESRRRHPLAKHGAELRAAINAEHEILTEIHNSADLIVDTSNTSIYELAEVIRERVDRREDNTLSVLIESFGFKHGIPADADFVFDMRCLPNPYWTLKLRGLTGLDNEVIEFLESHDDFLAMHRDILAFLDSWIPRFKDARRGYLTIAIGCTGGQHRSVCMAEKLAATLRDHNDIVRTRHNSLNDNSIR